MRNYKIFSADAPKQPFTANRLPARDLQKILPSKQNFCHFPLYGKSSFLQASLIFTDLKIFLESSCTSLFILL